MAKDFFDLFRFRSKKEREKEQADYAAWAFPYGQAQREKVQALLGELMPREDEAIAMVFFLTGKEAFCDKEGDRKDEKDRNPLRDATDAMRRNGMRVKNEHLPLYLALILADSWVDERLLYPEAGELRAMAAGLELP